MPGNLAFDLQDDIRAAVDDGALTIAAVEQFLQTVAQGIFTAEAIESEAGPDAIPLQLVTAAPLMLPVVIIGVFLPLICVTLVIIILFRDIVRKAPFGLAYLAGTIDHFVSMLFRLLQDMAAFVEHGIHVLFGFWRSLFRLWLHGEGVVTQSEYRTSSRAENRHFTRWISTIQHDLHRLNAQVWHGPHSVNARLNSADHDLRYINHELGRVWHQLGQVHAPDLSGLHHSINQLQQRVSHAEHQIQQIQHDLNQPEPKQPVTLPRIVHDELQIHQLQQHIDSLQRQVDSLPTHVTGRGGMTQHQVHQLNYAHYVSAHLAPLLALLPLTAGRIGNLKALEDNPCQCEPSRSPQLPHLGGIGMEGIIADLVIKDGI